MLAYLLFFFVVFGSKVLLAAITIFLLLPSDRRCNRCEADTILIRMSAPGRALARLLGGRIQRRWCPGCGWGGLARVDSRGRRDAAFRIHLRSARPRTSDRKTQ